MGPEFCPCSLYSIESIRGINGFASWQPYPLSEDVICVWTPSSRTRGEIAVHGDDGDDDAAAAAAMGKIAFAFAFADEMTSETPL